MQLHLIVVWYHWKLPSKKEGNCSGRSRERRILLTHIQLLLLQFVNVIWSIPTNFALFQKLRDKFFYKLDNLEIICQYIPCKFQEHWKQGRLLNRASERSNFLPRFEFTSDRPHYSLALFWSFICTCTTSKKDKFAFKRTLNYFPKKFPEYANNWRFTITWTRLFSSTVV